MAGERVLESNVVLVGAVAGNRVRGVAPDVHEKEVEAAVAVVVEEHRAGRMSHVVEARCGGDVSEAAVAVVLEQHIAAAHRRDVEVGVTVVVDVRERGGDADLPGDTHSGGRRDVLKLPASETFPQLIAAHLVDEVDVNHTVPIDVRYREPVSMVVVRRLVRLSGIVDAPVPERDAALFEPIGELEVMERRDAPDALHLGVAKPVHPRHVLKIVGHRLDDGSSGRSLSDRGDTSDASVQERRAENDEEQERRELADVRSNQPTWILKRDSRGRVMPL